VRMGNTVEKTGAPRFDAQSSLTVCHSRSPPSENEIPFCEEGDGGGGGDLDLRWRRQAGSATEISGTVSHNLFDELSSMFPSSRPPRAVTRPCLHPLRLRLRQDAAAFQKDCKLDQPTPASPLTDLACKHADLA
jgi:hypothetical protein